MRWNLELWSEGSTDHRVLVPIVTRTLRELSGLSDQSFAAVLSPASTTFQKLSEMLRTVTGLPGLPRKFSGYARKLLQALDGARRQHPRTLFVAIWDHDVDPHRLVIRREVNGHLREFAQLGSMSGLCVPELEAWLIADPAAFKACFGRGPERGFPGKPEEEKAPKTVLADILASCADSSHHGTVSFQRLAEHIDLGELTRKCPTGYGAFRADAKDLLCPLISSR